MQRPTRVMVFGVLCLLVGALSTLDNAGNVVTGIVGPSAMDAAATPGGDTGLGKMMSDTNAAMRTALGNPVFRWGTAVDGLAGLVMAMALLAAGVGLLKDQLWALKLARAWAWFGLVSAVVTVVLQVRYVMPNVPTGVAVSPLVMSMASAACTLPFMWLFPVLVLTVLSRPVVWGYLRAQSSASGGGRTSAFPFGAGGSDGFGAMDASPPGSPDSTSRGGEATGSSDQNQPKRSVDLPDVDPTLQTWRDDPWNDPRA